jgi:hypothetical protein
VGSRWQGIRYVIRPFQRQKSLINEQLEHGAHGIRFWWCEVDWTSSVSGPMAMNSPLIRKGNFLRARNLTSAQGSPSIRDHLIIYYAVSTYNYTALDARLFTYVLQSGLFLFQVRWCRITARIQSPYWEVSACNSLAHALVFRPFFRDCLGTSGDCIVAININVSECLWEGRGIWITRNTVKPCPSAARHEETCLTLQQRCASGSANVYIFHKSGWIRQHIYLLLLGFRTCQVLIS